MGDNPNQAGVQLLDIHPENGPPMRNPMQPYEDNVFQNGPQDGHRPVHGYAP